MGQMTRGRAGSARENPTAHYHRGLRLAGRGRPAAAADCYRAAVRLRPDFAEAHNNLGVVLRQLQRAGEAEASYRAALRAKPDSAVIHYNLGIALKDQRRLPEAIDSFRSAIALRPDFAEAHCNLGHALLVQGELAAGWREHEWRYLTPDLRDVRRVFAQPQWTGDAMAGATLLIHAEQGFGDTLQFCRYAPLAAARGLRVILEAPRPLLRLLRSLPGVAGLVAAGDPLPAFDLHCPMMSLPFALGTTLATVPAAPAYLQPDPAQAARWAVRLGARTALRVGLVWAGNPRRHSAALAEVDARRSIAPALLAPLFAARDVRFFSLQKDGPGAPEGVALTDPMHDMADFADTAALIANLDLVIAVDTAVAHLAAAIGRPVWLLDRFDHCWRWIAGRRDTPWYPTMRLYRQASPGDWSPVVAEVAAALQRLAAAHALRQPPPPRAALDEAVRHHRAGRLSEAERLCRQILQAEPHHADAANLLGLLAAQTGQPAAALGCFAHAVGCRSDVAAFHCNLGNALQSLGRDEEAIGWFRSGLALAPDHAGLHSNLGVALRRQGRLAEAIASLRRALALQPDHPGIRQNLDAALRQHAP
jgi:tetratricopeptide (TPR) repeat protein